MRKKLRLTNILFSLLLLCIAGTLSLNEAATNKREALAAKDTVIFAVGKSDEFPDAESFGEYMIDPVVLIKKGRYSDPPMNDGGYDDQPDLPTAKFLTYYEQTLRVLWGGAEVGKITAKRRYEPGCFMATADLESSLEIKTGREGLATNSKALGKKAGPQRRDPTDDERKALVALAETVYRQHGVRISQSKKIDLMHIIAGDLNGDGQSDLIADILVKGSEGGQEVSHMLFLILEPVAGSYRTAYSSYDEGPGNSYERIRVIDYLDLDGDGVAEVIADVRFKKENDKGRKDGYRIYKKKGRIWQKVYQGGGGVC
jgi:hypothetical protein